MRVRLLLAAAIVSGGLAAERSMAGEDPLGDAVLQKPSVAPVSKDPVTAKIRETLGHPTVIDFVETPLSEALQFLEDYHQVEFEIDGKALDELGIGADTPITHHTRDVTLRSALNRILRPLDLTYVVSDQALYITTQDVAQDMLSTRVYPVADLVLMKDGRLDWVPLVRAISSSVEPDSWGDAGGPGSIVEFRGSLVISQTEPVHERIEELLLQLRAPEAKQASDAVPDPIRVEESDGAAASGDATHAKSEEQQ